MHKTPQLRKFVRRLEHGRDPSECIRQPWRCGQPTDSDACHVRRHVRKGHKTIARQALHEFQRDSHGEEQQRRDPPFGSTSPNLSEPNHEAGVGDEVLQLVAFLPVNLRWIGYQGEVGDNADAEPACPQPQPLPAMESGARAGSPW